MISSWDTSCLDWETRIRGGHSLVPTLPLFAEEAARGLRIFRRLRVPDMHGKPAMADVAGPWLFPIIEAIFGSYDPETHVRALKEFFWLIPKKNGKSSTAAAIMVVALIVNRRPEAEYLLIGPTKETADIAFRQARATIKADPELDKIFHSQDHLRKITHRLTGATLMVKAADTDVITGGKQVATLIDELHVFARRHNAADILIEVKGALAARPDGFVITITTQSKQPPAGIFKSELEKARRVRDGELKLPLLPILYELPQGLAQNDGWKAPATWRLVNPNLGRSVDEEFLVTQLRAAEDEGPAQLALFASQHLNVQVGLALRMDRWPGADYWEGQAEPGLTLKKIIARSDIITMGVDGGGLDDLLGVAVVGRDRETGQWLGWCHAYMHPMVLEKRKSEAPKLLDFVNDGDLTIVDRLEDAFEAVAATAADVDSTGVLAAVGFDPWGVAGIVNAMEAVDIEEDRRTGISQGYKLTGTIKMAEVKLADGEMVHCGAPLMSWCVANAKIEPKGNAIVVTKQASGTGKIDPLMALFNAVALMSQNPIAPSVYTGERGLVVFG